LTDERARPESSIVTTENGPLCARGRLSLVEADGTESAHEELWLCRCGASKDKPRCDGSHRSRGFVASGEPPERASEPLEAFEGALRIKPGKHGALRTSGPLEILGEGGRCVWRTREAWLCRCGQSATKPYCDGSHNRVGWKSE
jgi:CDGSH-type Zn-finger protein